LTALAVIALCASFGAVTAPRLIWMLPTLAGGISTPLAYAVPPEAIASARNATDAGQWRRW
jgi:hypothetical protein